MNLPYWWALEPLGVQIQYPRMPTQTAWSSYPTLEDTD